MAFGNDRAEADTALASWYGPGFHGQTTASGEVYNAYGYTAAHKTLPLGTRVRVTNTDNDTAGFILSKTTASVSEAGTTFRSL